MTTQTLAPAANPRRTRFPNPRSAGPFLVPAVVAVALLVTEGLSQAVTPFIRKDDWPFLVPAGTTGVPSAVAHDLTEGRWLNTAWWHLVGQYGTPTTAALTYAAGYALLVAGLWRVLHHAGIRPGPLVDALLGLAVFASAVWVQLLYWPGTLTPSVLVAAAGAWTLPWAARSRVGLGAWLLLTEVAAVLSYPPVGVVLVLFAVVLLRDAPWRGVLALLGGWVAAFAVGVGIAYTLNWVAFGDFGLKIASWRHPDPLTSLHALHVNASRYVHASLSLWAGQWWAAVAAAVAVVVGWRDPAVRPRLERLLVGLAVVATMDAAQTLLTGIVTEARGQLWTWLVALLPVALLLDGRRVLHLGLPRGRWLPVDRLAVAALVVLAAGGVLAWRADVGEHQSTRAQYAAIAADATHARPDGKDPVVVVYQDPAVRPTRAGNIMAGTLRFAVRQDDEGTFPRWCTPVECREIAARTHSRGHGSVFDLGRIGNLPDVVAVVVPTPPTWI
ncbi:hypothetical protein [Intrasporangium flavum]|uniref:hypothetical protein n=1 Tax=Intrasporangium flavum TaxID=1428657 RepID=UPI00096C76B9|nr:hypothetical protein [Intrasporangium flavum]